MPPYITITAEIAEEIVRRGEKLPSALALHCRFPNGLFPPSTSHSFLDRAAAYCQSNGLTEACNGLADGVTDAEAHTAAADLLVWEFFRHRVEEKQAKDASAANIFVRIRRLFRATS